jgi:hypothetical protein
MNMEIGKHPQEHIDLMQYLFIKYRDALEGAAHDAAKVDELAAQARDFFKFCQWYLDNNRATGSFAATDNLGIRIQTDAVLLAKGTEIASGSMLSADGKPMDPNAPLSDILANSGAVPITGVPNQQQEGLINYSDPSRQGQSVDKTAGGQMKNYSDERKPWQTDILGH